MSTYTPMNLTVLGATGSIGRSTLDVAARHPDRFKVFALTARQRVDALLQLCLQFAPRYAVVERAEDAKRLRDACREASCATAVLHGAGALIEVAAAPEVDVVMAAIVGAAGLEPTMAAARAGKRLLLANKEALVVSGDLFMRTVTESGAELLPIDSEHNAVFQSLPSTYLRDPASAGVRRILLTASGGPFRETDPAELLHVTPEQACAHPNWVMGRKISVDSATMMNKGLEVIEAHWLFGVTPENIQVVVHPQSVIHSMVEYVDGSVLAQLGNPDMRTPIAHAMGYPDRIESGVRSLDLFEIAHLDFQRPDPDRFPCLQLAYQALKAGGDAAVWLNAANEIAVAAFLEQRIGFTQIADVVAAVLDARSGGAVDSLEAVLAADQAARRAAGKYIEDRIAR